MNRQQLINALRQARHHPEIAELFRNRGVGNGQSEAVRPTLVEFDALALSTPNIHGPKGTETTIYSTTLPAGLYRIHCTAAAIDVGVNNRSTYVIRLDTASRQYYGSDTYIRDDSNTFDSGSMTIETWHQATEGEAISIVVEVLDVQTTSGTVPLNASKSNLYIDAVQ